MRLPSFGRHLHNQIVIPLVAAIAVVGFVATLIAVSLIGQVINVWVDQNARFMSSTAVTRFAEEGESLVREAKLVAANPAFDAAARALDIPDISGRLVLASQSLGEDNVMLLDDRGSVIASTGRLQAAPGSVLLAPEDRTYLSTQMSHAIIVRLGDACTISAVQPVKGPNGVSYTLVLSKIVDDAYLEQLSGTSRAALALYDDAGSHVACYVPTGLPVGSLTRTFEGGSPVMTDAIARAAAGKPESQAFKVGDAEYRVIAEEISFSSDPSSSLVYLATTVSTDVAGSARLTTTNLITMWSVVAVIVLIFLGFWVARSISRPLSVLSQGAARIAEGDFSAKVDVAGDNELTDLAQNFNLMTDSLRERSESLTKKVLELATLYEMSRSLGSTLELDTLLDSVLDSALRIFDVEIGYITLVNHETGTIQVRAWKGADLSRSGDDIVRNSMSEWVIREGRPLIFNPQLEAANGSRGDSISGALAALCVPLTSSEGSIGSITVGSRSAEQRFTGDDVRLLATIANHVTIAVGNIGLFSSVQEAYLATVRALAAAVDAKDPYTRGHSDGVAEYALRIGEGLNLSQEQMVALEMAAYLHDIGKIGIPEDILLKPGKLTDAEMSQMRHHPLIGANILKPVAFPWPIAPIVRHHHEHYNGAGYPAGLKTEEIPLLARVLTVADAFEAMVADRPYRRGRSQQEAILELRRCSGTQFDPRIVDAFIQLLESAELEAEEAADDEDEIGPDEAQAVYIAIADAMFAGFRRLGGPRLANNLEARVNERLRDEDVPLSLQGGHLVSEDGQDAGEDVSGRLHRALEVMAESIEAASGTGLADHFLAEALETLPERMRTHAGRLGFAAAS